MNQASKLISTVFLLAVIVFGGQFCFSQTETKQSFEPNYEAMLYVIIGSSDPAQNADMPKSLSSVSRQLRDTFAYTSYSLANTYFGRIANSGGLEYKSVSNIFGLEQGGDSPSFLDWRLAGLKSTIDDSGKRSLQIQAFRFGARVPVKFADLRDQSGKPSVSINYESVGLTLDRMGVPEGSPTLIGTITLPKTTGTMFLVLAIRPV